MKRVAAAICAVAAVSALATGCGKGSSTSHSAAKHTASAAKSSAAKGSAAKTAAGRSGTVYPGAFCSSDGAKGKAANGTAYVCKKAKDGRDHWEHSA
ncbi:hypothetical protein P0W64_07270 [Tsukamurella sp. 8F]|uniref:hypothetical protein n=1 Tax=unclassified Tsukamurella TaxID=2633480 RepID=UPI0023B9A015|nr:MULTISPECIES: hypothetical protein [unclassified Tsukamurella]MDF0530256.1 hypothetical protein [Tsukamurella sp. 8J]MDF0586573.1 hypothetical protein [Tsukamurella sp. 8F]